MVKVKIALLIVVVSLALEVVLYFMRRKAVWDSDRLPFESSGCTGFVNSLFGIDLKCWCIEHDRRYRPGGGFADRLFADIRISLTVFAFALKLLFQTIVAFALVFIIWCGTRIGGAFAFHWRTPHPKKLVLLVADAICLLVGGALLFAAIYLIACAVEFITRLTGQAF
jgi:hypothetical protein